VASTRIRINRSTHEVLREMAEKEGTSSGALVDRLVEQYKEQEFRRAVYEGYRGLREDPAEWGAYQEMVRPWDATLLDGLEDKPDSRDDNVT